MGQLVICFGLSGLRLNITGRPSLDSRTPALLSPFDLTNYAFTTRRLIMIMLAAISFLCNYIPADLHSAFYTYLQLALEDRFTPLWRNQNASALRTIKVLGGRCDRILIDALIYLNLPMVFPNEMCIYIDPDCVSFRLQDESRLQTLWRMPEEVIFSTPVPRKIKVIRGLYQISPPTSHARLTSYRTNDFISVS
jgi:BTG family